MTSTTTEAKKPIILPKKLAEVINAMTAKLSDDQRDVYSALIFEVLALHEKYVRMAKRSGARRRSIVGLQNALKLEKALHRAEVAELKLFIEQINKRLKDFTGAR